MGTDRQERDKSRRFTLRSVLGIVLVFGFMAALTLLFWIAIPKQNEQLITYMLGQLSGFVGAVVGYHYTMNALNAKASENTGAAFDAMLAQAQRSDPLPKPTFGQEHSR